MTPEQVREAHASVKMSEVVGRLNAVAAYGTSLPAATGQFGIVGFCWGGGVSFAYATEQPNLKAAVVYYGVSAPTEALARVRAPVLGLYGGDDARVNATIPAAEAEMKRLGKLYEPNVYAGAGHGFLRQQDGREGANMRATQAAWPRTIAFFRQHLESRMSMQAEQIPFVAARVPAVSAHEDDCGDSCGLPAAY
jgi:carboxymethylenebutenolidase